MKKVSHFSGLIFRMRFVRATFLSALLLIIQVSIWAQKSATITGNATVCEDAPSPLVTFTGSGGTAPYIFTYNIDGGINLEAVSDGSGIAIVSVPTDVTGDVVYTLVSVDDNFSEPVTISGSVTITVLVYLPVSVTIEVSDLSVCVGDNVTFTATDVNGGTTFYQWKVNGIDAGPNSSIFIYAPANGDIVTCEVISNLLCTTGSPATSNAITMMVNAPETPTFAAIGPYCEGETAGVLPLTSIEGIPGTWTPSTITTTDAGSIDYLFTPDAGECATTATITVLVTTANTIALTSGAGTNNQTLCVNTAIANITYSTTGATGATVTGLPAGVNANWLANIVTISGTPTIEGTYNYIVTLTGGCGNITANGTITVNSCLKTLTLNSVLLEGLYIGSGTMRQAQNASGAQWPVGVADHITVELHDATNYLNIVWSATDVPLSTTGSAIISVPPAYSGTYFITIRHRNSIETTTSTAVSFAGSSITRSFASRSSVFGSNLGSWGDGYYVIYGADVNQDGIVDTGDMNEVDNGSTAILIGYNLADTNGDGIVDTSDMNIVDNNSTAIVMIRLP